MEEAEQFEHCLMLDGGRLLAAGPATNWRRHPSGKLDDAFTHFQGAAGAASAAGIPPRQATTARSPSRPTT
jgi:ribosome-dependent ATPase